MSEDEPTREVAPPSQPQYEERAISESLTQAFIAAGGIGGLAGGAAAVANTVHHWGGNQPQAEPPPTNPPTPHIELPPGVSGGDE